MGSKYTVERSKRAASSPLSTRDKKNMDLFQPPTMDATRRRAPNARRVRFLVGIALMAVSFLVYPAYSVIILFLPLSGEIKVGVIVAASLLSWGVFSAGIFLAGREGYDRLKGLWKR